MKKTKEQMEEKEIEDLFEDYGTGGRKNRKAGKNGRAKRRNIFKIPLILTSMLLCFLVGGFCGAKWYLRSAKQETSGRPQNVQGEGELSLEVAQILSEDPDQAQQELKERLLEEYETGAEQGKRDVLDKIRLSLTDGKSIVDSLRPYYDDQIIIASNGQYHFVPIRDDMKHNSYEQEHLQILDNGELQYEQDGNVTSYKGIDVSKFQGEIDWQQVASDGVTFAFIRAGFRGYGEKGTLVADEAAEANIAGANSAGIKTGVYFYTQAITLEEAREEAQLVLDLIAPYRIDCPVVIDVEKVSKAGARMNALSPKERTDIVLTFCEMIEQAGYQPMVYYNMEMATLMLETERLEQYDKWFAYYRTDLYYPYEYLIWQYSDKGQVAGISENVDMNIAFKPIWKD